MTEINFDEYDTNEKISYELLPEGRYRCAIVESSISENKAGTGENLKLVIKVVAGEFAGKRVFENIVWKHDNDKAVQFGRIRFAELRRAVGVLTPSDTEQLHNLPFDAIVGVKKGTGGYEDSNCIKKYIEKQTGFTAQKPAPKQEETEKNEDNDNVPW